MADIAAAAGVSRQTLYKEFGSRDEFAQAFVIHEGERFLDDVEAAVREHLDDPRAAVGAALETFLRTAGEDPLVRILLSDDGTGGMLPFVTTQGMPVVLWATARLSTTIEEGWPQAPAEQGPAARRIAGPAGDQLHHRPHRLAARRPRPQRRRAARPVHRRGARHRRLSPALPSGRGRVSPRSRASSRRGARTSAAGPHPRASRGSPPRSPSGRSRRGRGGSAAAASGVAALWTKEAPDHPATRLHHPCRLEHRRGGSSKQCRPQ